MSVFRRRKDASHSAIVKTFRAMGCSVLVIESSTAGCPDLAVGCAGRTHLVECKPSKSQAAAKKWTLPSEAQAKLHAAWRGSSIPIVHDAKEVSELVQMWRLEAANADRAAQLLKRELDAVLKAVHQ